MHFFEIFMIRNIILFLQKVWFFQNRSLHSGWFRYADFEYDNIKIIPRFYENQKSIFLTKKIEHQRVNFWCFYNSSTDSKPQMQDSRISTSESFKPHLRFSGRNKMKKSIFCLNLFFNDLLKHWWKQSEKWRIYICFVLKLGFLPEKWRLTFAFIIKTADEIDADCCW